VLIHSKHAICASVCSFDYVAFYYISSW